MTSDDLENHSFLITGSRASFWYIIYLGLKMFGFWPQMTPNTPNLGSGDLNWPRKRLFRNHRTKSFILVYNLPWFETLSILTPNTPNFRSGDLDWPRKPLFRNHRTKSFILVFNLSRFENCCILTPTGSKFL